jgi:hypothetical protein
MTTTTTDDDPITLAERYIGCATSSHLRVETARCDADMLIAAGKLSSRLGVLLWRLRGEFDAAKASVRPDGELNLTERALVLMGLRTLHTAKQALWAQALPWLEGEDAILLGKEDAAHVVGRVLDAWLDPMCPGCEGRGFNGGTHRGEREMTCRACRGTRLRRTSIARNGMQRLLADKVHFAMSEAMFTTEVEMRGLLRERESA